MAQQKDNLPPAGSRMKAAEYFQYAESALPRELINGIVVQWPLPAPEHQRLLGELAFAVNKLIPDGDVFYSALDVYLDDDNVVQPDIAWVAPKSRCVIGEKRLEGPPDLIIEILSPATAENNQTVKHRLYEKRRVREYWLVDPSARSIEVHRLEKTKFVRQGSYGVGQSFNSAVIGGVSVDVSAVLGI